MAAVSPGPSPAAEAGAVQQARAKASANRCFGRQARPLRRPGTHRIKRYEAVIVLAKVTIIAKGDNRICAGPGGEANISLGKGLRNLVKLGDGDDFIRVEGPTRETRIDAGDGDNRIIVRSKAKSHKIVTGAGNDNVIAAAKATSYWIGTGAGDDKITIRPPAKALKRTIKTGLGQDTVMIRAKGDTRATLGAASNPHGLPDTNFYSGGHSNDYVTALSGDNYIDGNDGADVLRSVGNSRAKVLGGNGSDRIYSNGGDRLIGGRGNDRIEANLSPNIGGVFADGGAGDDWLYGSDGDDILIGAPGIDKFKGFGGNDLFRANEGLNKIEGGSGVNTVSFAAHIPPGYQKKSGVMVDLAAGIARGGTSQTHLAGVQNVIGSSFDDIIKANPNQPGEIWGGLGNDEIVAYKGDKVHPGFQRRTGPEPVVNMSPDGVLTVLGGAADDTLRIGRNAEGAYTVDSAQPLLGTGESCTMSGARAICHVPELLNILVHGGAGDDAITIDESVPADISTVLDGGAGRNVILGGNTADYIYTGHGGPSILDGRGGDDVLKTSDTSQTILRGGDGHDVLRSRYPCYGHQFIGGAGKDNAVFAGSSRGVEINFTHNYVVWQGVPGCTPTRLANDIEAGEGTRNDDLFVGSKKRGLAFLGRDGIDTFLIKNGRRDVITTGPGGRRNKVIADRFDKITYGWGLAAYSSPAGE